MSKTSPTPASHLRNSSRSADLYDRACAVLPGGNTRTTVYTPPHPIYASHGQGCRIWDVEGVARIDFLNNYTALIHGHAHPAITAAATQQIARGACFSMPTESEIALAELLCNRVASIEQIRFTNSGSEAVMMAIKAARAFTGRFKIAKAEGAYHGSYDHMEVSEDAGPGAWGEPEPLSLPYSKGTAPSILDEVVVFPLNDLALTETIIRRHAAELAAIIIDPLAPRIGLIPARQDWLSLVRGLCDELAIVLISDEIISFRTAYGGAQQSFGFRADLTTLGKIIGGGFPVGALGGRSDIMAVFDPTQGKPAVPHGGTFNANPVTMVAGRVAMDLMTERAYERLERLGDRLAEGIEAVFRESGIDGQVTGRGSIRRIHLTTRKLHDYRSAYPGPKEKARMAKIYDGLLSRGVLMAPGGMIALSTAMSDAEINHFINALREVVSG
ncbi:aspartate aminotransferase family protein [Rhodoligotrophos ferricapiens]|uniref:aspartate aminotransferase family protein n=1 Tax=Rhodoligotrophos ferricapiens TaxID=3069264 RepID=UPI00315C5F29